MDQPITSSAADDESTRSALPRAGDDEGGFRGTTTDVLSRLKGVQDPAEVAEQLRSWRAAATSRELMPRFALKGQIGLGAQGLVFTVHDADCRRDVALKCLHEERCDGTEISRFIHEAQITAQLEHPGIVPVHDFGVLPDGTVFYTMKRIDGESLAQHLMTRAGRAEPRFELLHVFLKVCDAIGFAHSRGVIHRDLKPRNIMVGRYGEVLVMDWGLAKVVGEHEAVSTVRSGRDSELDAFRTLTGLAVGTPAYMSPEQARGETAAIDQRSDIYCLGVLLYEMLSGESPYRRGDVARTLEQVAAGRIIALDAHDAGASVARSLVAIVHKAMAWTPAARYPRVEDLADDLRRFISGAAVTARRESTGERVVRTLRRWKWPLLAAAAMVLAAVLTALAVAGAVARKEGRDYAALRARAGIRQAAGDLAAARADFLHLVYLRGDDHEARLRLVELDEDLRRQHARERDQEMRQQAEALIAEARTSARVGSDGGLRRATELSLKALGLLPGDADLLAQYEDLVERKAVLDEQARQEAVVAGHRERADELERAAMRMHDQGLLREAARELEAAVALAATPARTTALGQILTEIDGRERAQRASERQAGRNHEAERLLGDLATAAAAGQGDRAKELFDQVRWLTPGHPALPEHERLVAEAQHRQHVDHADRILVAARTALAGASGLGQRISELRGELRALESRLVEQGDTNVRSGLHQREHALRALEEQRSAEVARAIERLYHAHAIAPGHPAVRRALADYFAARLIEAEAVDDRAAASAAEAQGRVFDDGTHQELFSGLVAVAVSADSVPLHLQAIVGRADRSDGPEGPVIAAPAGAMVRLRAGRYLAIGGEGNALACRFRRGQSASLHLSRRPWLPAGMALVPGGTAYARSGEPLAAVTAFALAVHEVTAGEYLEFLNDPAVRVQVTRAWADERPALAPRDDGQSPRPLWRRLPDGSFDLAAMAGPIDPRQPVCGISHDDAVAYVRWRAQRDGRAWRLPTAAEWSFAVQGGDGRAQPWGGRSDPTRCASALTLPADGQPPVVGSFAADHSVQGVRDLAGSLAEFVDATGAQVMGGCIYDRHVDRFTAWSRRELHPAQPCSFAGIRLALSLP